MRLQFKHFPSRTLWVCTSAQASGISQHPCCGSVVTCVIRCVQAFSITNIMGVYFCAGEWGQHPRCGSVVTCVIRGRSVYGVVNRFLTVDDDCCPGYASVTWFSEPTYPYGHPLVVRVGPDWSALHTEIGCIVKISQIDPSCVVIEPYGDHFFVMRQSGYDTVSAATV